MHVVVVAARTLDQAWLDGEHEMPPVGQASLENEARLLQHQFTVIECLDPRAYDIRTTGHAVKANLPDHHSAHLCTHRRNNSMTGISMFGFTTGNRNVRSPSPTFSVRE